MNITDFTNTKGVFYETNGGTFLKTPTSLKVTFGDYARVTEHITLVEGDYMQASVRVCLPKSYPFGARMWSERFVTLHNWQQDTINTVRIGLMCTRAGKLALVSNRGKEFGLLAVSSVVPPLGVEFTLSMQVYLSSVHGLTIGYLNGKRVLYSTAPNIDPTTVIGRCCIGIDGAGGALNQSATFANMVSAYEKRI